MKAYILVRYLEKEEHPAEQYTNYIHKIRNIELSSVTKIDMALKIYDVMRKELNREDFQKLEVEVVNGY